MKCPNCENSELNYWESIALGVRVKGYKCSNCYYKVQTEIVRGVGESKKRIKKRKIIESG